MIIGPKDKNGWDLKALHRNLPLPIRLWTYEKGLKALSLGLPQARRSGFKTGRVHLSGFFNQGFGIGRAGDLTHLGLNSLGIKHQTHGLSPKPDPNCDDFDGGGVWIIHANAPEAIMALIKTPKTFWENKKRIAYWAWETPIMPEFWAYCAQYFHEIWFPSHYCLNAASATISKQRRYKPILRLVPHPVGLWRAETYRRPNDIDFKVLSLFDLDSSSARKNPELAVKAYLQAFDKPQSGTSLTIKISGVQGSSKALSALNSLIHNRPDISLRRDKIPETQMREFLASHDALLSLHRSEGFGLSLAEAMDLGLSVIATEGSGPEDYLNAETGFVIPASTIPIRDPLGPYAFYRDQTWHEADLNHAVVILKSLSLSLDLRQSKTAAAQKMIDRLTQDFQSEVTKALIT